MVPQGYGQGGAGDSDGTAGVGQRRGRARGGTSAAGGGIEGLVLAPASVGRGGLGGRWRKGELGQRDARQLLQTHKDKKTHLFT